MMSVYNGNWNDAGRGELLQVNKTAGGYSGHATAMVDTTYWRNRPAIKIANSWGNVWGDK